MIDALPTRILIATPAALGMVTVEYVHSVMQALYNLGTQNVIANHMMIRNESYIPRARNHIASEFMAMDPILSDDGKIIADAPEFLMFVDADIEFPPSAIWRLICHGKDIAVAAYPKKAYPINYAINALHREDGTIEVRNGLVAMAEAATGFMLIRRRVFQRLKAAHPELKLRLSTSYPQALNKSPEALARLEAESFGYFHPSIIDQSEKSEDYAFCNRWRALGGEIWLDPDINLNHIGAHTFEGDVGRILSAVE